MSSPGAGDPRQISSGDHGIPRVQQDAGEVSMLKLAKRFGNDDSGGTSFEYGLIAAGIAVGLGMVVVSLGAQLKSTFTQIAGSPPQASSAALFRPARLQDGPFP